MTLIAVKFLIQWHKLPLFTVESNMNLNDQIIKPLKYNHNSYFDHPVIASHLCYTTYSIYLRKGLKMPR